MVRYITEPLSKPRDLSGDGSDLHLKEGDAESVAEIFDTPLSGSYVWDYCSRDRTLARLYRLGRERGWSPDSDIDWTLPLDRHELPFSSGGPNPYAGWEAWESLGDARQIEFAWHQMAWRLSQFLHGEQGALLVASQLVSCAPTHDGKLYAASQTFDEARHVEVFSKYVRERLRLLYPVSPGLKRLLDGILGSSLWDVKFIGMQMIIESLALAAMPISKARTRDRTQHQIIDFVLRDEARHVAFGMSYLHDHLDRLGEPERERRARFAFDACRIMMDDIAPLDAYAHFGMDPEEGRRRFLASGELQMFRKLLFSRIMPNLQRLGLITPRVSEQYASLGLLDLATLPDDANVDWGRLEAPLSTPSQ